MDGSAAVITIAHRAGRVPVTSRPPRSRRPSRSRAVRPGQVP